MMIRGFFTTFLMKQRLGIFGFGKASLGLGLLLISINSDLSVYKGTYFQRILLQKLCQTCFSYQRLTFLTASMYLFQYKRTKSRFDFAMKADQVTVDFPFGRRAKPSLIHIHNYHDFSNGVVIVCVKGRMGRWKRGKVFPMYHEKRMSMQNIAFSNSFLCKISHSTNCFCIFAPKNRMIMVDNPTPEKRS